MAQIIRRRSRRRASTDNETVYCPYCNYSCKRASVLSRHVNTKHPGQATPTRTKHELVEILSKSDSIVDMLHATAKFLAKGNILDSSLPPDVLKKLKDEDIKMRVAMRILQIAKLQRVLSLLKREQKLDELLQTKLDDAEWRDKANVHEVQRAVEDVEKSIKEDLSLIGEMSVVGDVDLADALEKLVNTFAPLSNVGAFEIRGITVPSAPDAREKIRQIVNRLQIKEGGDA